MYIAAGVDSGRGRRLLSARPHAKPCSIPGQTPGQPGPDISPETSPLTPGILPPPRLKPLPVGERTLLEPVCGKGRRPRWMSRLAQGVVEIKKVPQGQSRATQSPGKDPRTGHITENKGIGFSGLQQRSAQKNIGSIERLVAEPALVHAPDHLKQWGELKSGLQASGIRILEKGCRKRIERNGAGYLLHHQEFVESVSCIPPMGPFQGNGHRQSGSSQVFQPKELPLHPEPGEPGPQGTDPSAMTVEFGNDGPPLRIDSPPYQGAGLLLDDLARGRIEGPSRRENGVPLAAPPCPWRCGTTPLFHPLTIRAYRCPEKSLESAGYATSSAPFSRASSRTRDTVIVIFGGFRLKGARARRIQFFTE